MRPKGSLSNCPVFHVTNRFQGQQGASRVPPGLVAILPQCRQHCLLILVVPRLGFGGRLGEVSGSARRRTFRRNVPWSLDILDQSTRRVARR
jgi:hypothetical protein